MGQGGREDKEKRKKSKRIYRTNQNIRIINVFLESLLSESFPSLGVTVHLTSQGCPPILCCSLDLLWGQLRLESGPTLVCFCLQCPQPSELMHFLLWELSMSFYIFHRHSLSRWSCRFNLHLVKLVRMFWGFFLRHTAPGFQLWFYFHLCMWVIHWGLLLRLPWRTWVCPCEGQVWRWCSCLSCRGPGNTRYSGELAARAAGNIVL